MSLLSQVGRTIQGLKNTDLSGRFIPGSMKQTIDRLMPSRQAFQEGLRTVGAGISTVGGAMSKAKMPGFAKYTPPGIMTGAMNSLIGGQISGVGDTLQKTGVSKFTPGDALNMSAILPVGAGTKAIGKVPTIGKEFVRTIRPAARVSTQALGDVLRFGDQSLAPTQALGLLKRPMNMPLARKAASFQNRMAPFKRLAKMTPQQERSFSKLIFDFEDFLNKNVR